MDGNAQQPEVQIRRPRHAALAGEIQYSFAPTRHGGDECVLPCRHAPPAAYKDRMLTFTRRLRKLFRSNSGIS